MNKKAADIIEEMRGFEIDHEPDGWPAVRMRQVSALCDEVERLRRIESAAKNLIAQKGRHNTEIAYKRLEDVIKTHNAGGNSAGTALSCQSGVAQRSES